MTASLRPVKAAVSADDLLSRPDAEFVACAYLTLLRRPADPEGFLHYLLQLRSDGDKFAVVHALCTSEEGRLRRPNLPGLRATLARQRIKQLPVLRQIVALRKSEQLRGATATTDTAEAAATPSLELLDPAWYLKTYPTIVSTGLGPQEHYDGLGRAYGLLPNAAAAQRLLIDPQAYLDAYADVAQAGMDPWEHYTLLGRAEGRIAGVSLRVLQFDRDWYLKRNPDVAVAGVDPFQHFTRDGILHGRDSSSFKGLGDIEPEPLVYTDPLAAPEVRLVAFYLPQFHPNPEDHCGWEPGFTEWANMSLGRPFYAEHDQPRLPGELGCHDLRSSRVIRRQVELARSHGIHGFCFYWVGKRLLEQPVQQFLADSSMDISFCFCWASEKWTHRWDGLDQDVLTAQNHSLEDDLAFIEEVSRAFADPRYIRVDDKPMLVIYRPELLPDTLATVARWRDWCRAKGIGEIHLCSPGAFGGAPLSKTGMDATIEFPPATGTNQEITPAVPSRDPAFTGQINSYLVAAKAAGGYVRGSNLEYRGVMPGWDNTASRMERGVSFYGATPELYSEWLNHALEETRRNLPAAHRLVFVNAWNDWSEGAYLEPDARHGHAYLNRTREALAAFAPPVVNDADLRAKRGPTGPVAVLVHLHYADLFEAIAGYLDNVPEAFDLYFSVRDGTFSRMQQLIQARFPQATVVSYPNRGRDVLPFLHILARIRGFGYAAICKIHSKKSHQRDDGDRWRDDVLTKLLGSRTRVADILGQLQGGAGLVAPAGHLLDGTTYLGSNTRRVTQLAARMGCPAAWVHDFSFPAGTMFWCRPEALAPLLDLALGPDEFEPEADQVDGTTAHAFERLVGLSARKSGLTIVTTADTLEDDSTSYTFAAPTGGHA